MIAGGELGGESYEVGAGDEASFGVQPGGMG